MLRNYIEILRRIYYLEIILTEYCRLRTIIAWKSIADTLIGQMYKAIDSQCVCHRCNQELYFALHHCIRILHQTRQPKMDRVHGEDVPVERGLILPPHFFFTYFIIFLSLWGILGKHFFHPVGNEKEPSITYCCIASLLTHPEPVVFER